MTQEEPCRGPRTSTPEDATKIVNESKKIIFESSYRYLASLSADGQVEVWRMKGENPKFKWGLEFKSATQIETNSSTENQFFVLMSSKDMSVADK